MATEMTRDPRVVNADPGFSVAIRRRSAGAGEPGFDELQWAHDNDGHYATIDADIDTDLAWHFTEGDHSAMVAVADTGFDIVHPDLIENLDPVTPENFAVSVVDGEPADFLGGYSDFGSFTHGTSAAGVAGARGDNNKGYSGSCPRCRLLLIRHEHNDPDYVEAFGVAKDRNADVLSISWGFDSPIVEFREAIDELVTSGTTVVMAMTNEDMDNCGNINPDTSSLPNVIAVSGITDFDQRSPYYGEAKGHGKCMDVLAPTRGGVQAIHTTAVDMIDGEKQSLYWYDFSGTSAATPLVAGVIGLMKTLDNGLTPLEIQRILQDTADRVDPANASYSPEFGFSNPGGTPTHGHGRINAYEAVKLVAPSVPADNNTPIGRASMDLLLRDNPTDWGNTEKPSNMIFSSPRDQYNNYRSVDIKIDTEPYGSAVTTLPDFIAHVSESPLPGVKSKVYVRLRNRGPDPVANTTLKLHAAVVGNTYPKLPDDFWESFPADSTDTTIWKPVGTSPLLTVPYSGASVAGCPDRNVPACYPLGAASNDNALIQAFELNPMDWDSGSGQRLVLLAAAHSNDDPARGNSTGNPAFDYVEIAVNFDNNVTLWDPRENAGSNVSGGSGGLSVWLLATLFLAVAVVRRRQYDDMSRSRTADHLACSCSDHRY